MAYAPFVSDKPVISDDGGVVVQKTRENLMALRDGIVAGMLAGWNMTISNPVSKPPSIVWAKGTERIRATITWGTIFTVNELNPTIILYEYSANSGSTYDTIGTATMSYEGSGFLTSLVWS